MSPSSGPARGAAVLFAATIFCGAALLFLLEPHVGKALLPWYGGTPGVWNTCLFFFQFLLLAGYLYAFALQRWLTLRRQLAVHGLLLVGVAATLPIRLQAEGLTHAVQQPVWNVLADLSLSVGLVFFTISTTAPLLQAWYAAARFPGSPYLFYAASNLGSLLGLIAYPLAVEVWLPLSRQSQLLTGGVAGLVGMIGCCGLLCWGREPAAESADVSPAVPISARERLSWFAWSMWPSSLLLGVTTYLTSEIAPMPALWMLPLGLYLLTFVIAFSRPPEWIGPSSAAAFVVIALIVALSATRNATAGPHDVALQAGLLYCGALALHTRLAQHQPDVRHLTEYYLWISLGGVAGSAFNSLLAPAVFNWFAEYPLAIAAVLLLLPLPQLSVWRPATLVVKTAAAMIVLLGLSWNVYFSEPSRLVEKRVRTFFGEFQIVRGKEGVMRQLVHGRTIHGMQMASPEPRVRRPPLTYYFFTGPIGQVVLGLRGMPATKSVAVVGLGVGSLASYAEPGESYTFYEIDPAIAAAAQDPTYFHFLSDARARGAKVQTILGDARLRLREADDASYGLIVLDAFTSDAIPVHLLTKDAVSEYLTKLSPGGVLAFHISNLYVDLEPVLANLAEELQLVAYIQDDHRLVEEERKRGKQASTWMILARSADDLEPVLKSDRWRPARTRPELGVWTDDRSNLLGALRWIQSPPRP